MRRVPEIARRERASALLGGKLAGSQEAGHRSTSNLP